MGKAKKEHITEWPSGKLDFSQGCLLMGILNITPDSFSDGGKFFDTQKAIDRGIEMAREGAALIDIGAESTRPGSKPVSVKEQIKRAVPVIKALSNKINVPISIDTTNPEVAQAAIEVGAGMINDISALRDDRMAKLAAKHQTPVVLMHMQGSPATMQTKPEYKDIVMEVLTFLMQRAQKAEEYGIAREKIFIDPGIGFGKTLEHNILLLKNIYKFVYTGYNVLVGTSRKSFIGALTGKENPSDRIFGTAATVALCIAAGVSIVRVHDIAQMLDVIKVTSAIKSAKGFK